MAEPVASQALEILKSPESRIVDYFCSLLWAQLTTGAGDIGDHYVERIERRRMHHFTSFGIQHEFLLAYVKATFNGSSIPRQTYLVVFERRGALRKGPHDGLGLMNNSRCAYCEGDMVLHMLQSFLGFPSGGKPCEAVDTIHVLPDEFHFRTHSTCIAHVEFPAPGDTGSTPDPTEFSQMPEPFSDADTKRLPLYFYQLCLMAKRTHAHYKTWDAKEFNCQFYCAVLLHFTRLTTRCPLVVQINSKETKIIRWVDNPGRGIHMSATKEYAPERWRPRGWMSSFITWWTSPFVPIKREPTNNMMEPLLERFHEDIIEFEPQASKLRRKVAETGRWNAEQRRWLKDVIWLLQEKAKKLVDSRAAQTREAQSKIRNDVERLAAQILYILDTRNA